MAEQPKLVVGTDTIKKHNQLEIGINSVDDNYEKENDIATLLNNKSIDNTDIHSDDMPLTKQIIYISGNGRFLITTTEKNRGSEDNNNSLFRKQRKSHKPRTGPGPDAVNAPKKSKCSKCNEMLPSRTVLLKHKRTHHKKPIRCDMCGKIFVFLSAYQTHLNHHISDGDSLLCEICEITFRKIDQRKLHMVQVHNLNPVAYPCEKCKQNFVLKKTFEKHIETNRCTVAKENKRILSKTKSQKRETENSKQNIFKYVAPLPTTYWSDSLSE